MEDSTFIKSIRLRNLLSFGPESEEIELKPLNVLIGPNGSGKSNFIEAIRVLQAMPRDINEPFRTGAGKKNWFWKGETGIDSSDVTVIVNNFSFGDHSNIKHSFLLGEGEDFIIFEEIERNPSIGDEGLFYQLKDGKPRLRVETGKNNLQAILEPATFNKNQSVLSQYKGDISFPIISMLGSKYVSIKVYQPFAHAHHLMKPSESHPNDVLSESYRNIVPVMLNLFAHREVKNIIEKNIKLFNERFESFTPVPSQLGGGYQLLLFEKGLVDPIPAARLSDGTLLFLSLLTILCHPTPPPLICIEEPEIGLHPDILPTIAELLIDASKRTQIIVTTHSDILVSALSEQPDSILVCDHDERGTHMNRLDQKKLKKWLENYKLGELWRMGEIGGNRW